eukprot:TRINITY_DN4345_c0_g1_i2.p1 TRINITY_DN4345_c0_g1~~TRINITY_DN4345_c0_g1_i2.p1  ORF type:complete len:215 (-),score=56.24 TRINITY_DN4345_c0_g1_i2:339-983(-)
MALAANTGKLIAVLTNVVFLAVALFLIVVGSIAINSANTTLINGANILQFFPAAKIGAAFLVMGLVLLLITVAGVVGVLRKKKRLLCLYLPTVFLIVMAQTVLVIVLLVFSSKIDQILDGTMQTYWNNNPDADKQFQTSFNCCGYNGVDTGIQPCPTNFSGTCKAAAVTWINQNIKPVVIAVAVIVSLEIVAWISVAYVRSNVKDNEFEDKWVH